MENNMAAIRFAHIFANHRIVSATAGRRKLQTKRGVIFFIYFNAVYFIQLFDTALHLYGFGSFIAEAFDEVFRILYLFLLVFVCTKLLFATFFTQDYKFIIFHFVVIDLATSDFDGTGRYIIEESTVVADQYDCIGTCSQKVFQPLDTFNIEVIGRLVE